MRQSDKILFWFVALSTVFDYGMTTWGISKVGVWYEANPIARAAFREGPIAVWLFVASQISLSCVVLQNKWVRPFGWAWNLAATYGHIFGCLSWLSVVVLTNLPSGV